MLPCHIVKDLLPSYMEHLISPESEQAVEEHLALCEACQAAKAAMEAELSMEQAPKPRLDFIRRLKRKQMVGAVLSAAVTLVCLLGLYGLEYDVDLGNSAAVEALIQDEISYDERFAGADIQMVESIREKNQILVLYRLDDEEGYRGKGAACFSRGLLGKYRIHSIGATTWELDSYAPLRIGRQDYLLMGNVNPPVGAASVRIYADYHMPYYEGDPISELLKTTQPVYEGAAVGQRFQLLPLTRAQAEQTYWDSSAVYYDENGEMLDSVEIALQYYDMGDSISGAFVGSPRSLQALCVWMGLTLALGLIFTRYFLTF